MKIKKSQIRKIIKEEIKNSQLLLEGLPACCWAYSTWACCKAATGMCPCQLNDNRDFGTFDKVCCPDYKPDSRTPSAGDTRDIKHISNSKSSFGSVQPPQKVGGKEVKYSKNSKNLPDCCWDMAKKACCKDATGLCPCNIYTGSDGQTHGTFSAGCCDYTIPGGAGGVAQLTVEGRGEWGDLDACDCDLLEIECSEVELGADCENCMCKGKSGEAYPRSTMSIREENSCKQEGVCCKDRLSHKIVDSTLENDICICPKGSNRVNC